MYICIIIYIFDLAETQVTSLELNTWLRKTLETSTDQSLSNEIFQGRYWCERWEINPFVREKSRETFVRFTGKARIYCKMCASFVYIKKMTSLFFV